MPTIRSEFHNSLASQYLDNIQYERINLFYFLGKINQWDDESSAPPEPLTSCYEDTTIRDNILYIRKVTTNDVSLVIPNIKWQSGTVYDRWDHTIDMSDKQFYVVTTDFNIYKCLDNNLGVASTSMPSSTSLYPFTTSDGYIWKYMYNIPLIKRRKFFSFDYIPVQKALSDSFYSKGTIEDVVIKNGGSSYTSTPLTTIVVPPPSGSGTTAEISLTINSNGSVNGISIVGGGSGYLYPPKVTIPDPISGITAKISLTINGGIVNGGTIDIAGSGYTIAPVPKVEAPRITAEIRAYVNPSTKEIDSVAIINEGAGYSSSPTLVVVDSTGLASGKYNSNTSAKMVAYLYKGRIDTVAITDPGTNYSGDSSTTISVIGDGTGAQFYPKIEDGIITGIIIGNSGIGYSYIDINVEGDGTGAILQGIIGSSDFISDQSQVEQTSIPGAIYCINVSTSGTEYTETTMVDITGDGTGATAHAVVVDGAITQVIMDSYGVGYTYANVSFSDINRLNVGTEIDAIAYAILPPLNGHGFDAVTELFANTLAISVLIKDDYELNIINQDYRQFGLLLNPKDIESRRLILDTKSFATFNISVSNVENLYVDDILTNNNKSYRVVDINLDTIIVQQLSSIYTIPEGIFTKDNGITVTPYTILDVLSSPAFDKYSGKLMYVNNSTPLVPSATQSFIIRTYLTI